MADYDSPWEEALDQWFPLFGAFFFPRAHRKIHWSRRYETLDTELQQVVRDGELGRRYADKLVKVWLLDGTEEWLLVHVEVQGQREAGFERRVFVYNFRIFDRYNTEVVSLIVLADDDPSWRPTGFRYGRWGSETGTRFEPVKLLDYAGREAELEADANPFAAVVLAHLKTMETRQDAGARRVWKLRVLKGLYERGLDRQAILELFRLIDWMMDLPKDLETQFVQEFTTFEEEKKMPYVTSVERVGREQGFREGEEKGRREGEEKGRREELLESIAKGLNAKFGAQGLEFLRAVQQVHDVAKLRVLVDALWNGATLDDIRRLIE